MGLPYKTYHLKCTQSTFFVLFWIGFVFLIFLEKTTCTRKILNLVHIHSRINVTFVLILFRIFPHEFPMMMMMMELAELLSIIYSHLTVIGKNSNSLMQTAVLQAYKALYAYILTTEFRQTVSIPHYILFFDKSHLLNILYDDLKNHILIRCFFSNESSFVYTQSLGNN